MTAAEQILMLSKKIPTPSDAYSLLTLLTVFDMYHMCLFIVV